MSSERSLATSSGSADAGLRDKRAWYRSIEWPPEEPGKPICVRHHALGMNRSMFEFWPSDEDLPADAPFGTLASIRERSVFCALCRLIHQAAQGILYDEDVDIVGCWIRDGELKSERDGNGEGQDHNAGTSLRLRVTSPHLENRYNKYQICDVVPLDHSGPAEFFSGRVVNEKELDFSLIRSWLRDCERWHEECLHKEPWTKLPSTAQFIRLLDLETDCLVESPSPDPYVCLSYVWGKAPVFKTLKGNIHEMFKPGSLARIGKQIPLSIRDAIQAARFLGERYLWVDSLCIVQDDNEDKMQQISIMGEIYRRASLTLVVAGGDNASCGIGGIHKGSRDIQQNIAHYSDELSLVQLLPDGNQAVEDSVWNTRGWTYQERLLSRRCIFFANDMAYFHCQQADWSEDWKGEHPQLVRSASMTEIRLSMSWEAPTMHPRDVYQLAKRKTYFYEYCRLVKEYTSRGMTVTSDRIAGFEAVLGTFKFMYGISFAQALPEEMFHESLLWHSCSPNPQRINAFPSWAWAGWTGGVEYHDAFGDFNGLPVLRERWRRTRPICDVFFDDLTSHKRRTVRTCDYEMSELCRDGTPR